MVQNKSHHCTFPANARDLFNHGRVWISLHGSFNCWMRSTNLEQMRSIDRFMLKRLRELFSHKLIHNILTENIPLLRRNLSSFE